MFNYRPGWIVFLIVCICQLSFAGQDEHDYAPAKNPHFSLIEADNNHATIHYHFSEEISGYSRNSEKIYVGIPIGATYELELKAWDFYSLDRRKITDQHTGSASDSVEEVSAVEKMLESNINSKRFEFHELDGLRVQISSTQKHVITDLTFDISWQEKAKSGLAEEYKRDAGFSRLFRNLFINGDYVDGIRSKRTISESERVQGFHPLASGYRENGASINLADGPIEACTDSIRVLVQEQGITAIRSSDFHDIGIDPEVVQLDEARIWYKGEQCPLSIVGDGDGKLGEKDSILFYGVESDSEYTSDSVYSLTWFESDTPPQRIPEQSAEWVEEGNSSFTARKVWKQDNLLAKKNNNRYGWFYDQLDTQVKQFPLKLPGLAAEGEIKISLSLLNKTRENASFSASIGETTASFSLMINSATSVSFVAPATEGIHSSTLIVTLDEPPYELGFLEGSMSDKLGTIPFVFVDRIKVEYPRKTELEDESLLVVHEINSSTEGVALELSGATEPFTAWFIEDTNCVNKIVSGVSPEFGRIYLPDGEWDSVEITRTGQIPGPRTLEKNYPSSIHRKDQGYNYVIIAYHALVDSARRLAEWRRKSGFKVFLTDVQDIYDEFNYGYPDCDAIKRFLRYAQSEWDGLSPEFVVLAGESSWDHRDREKTWFPDQVPTYAPTYDPQHFASDGWYTYLWGGMSDYYFDVILGRISLQYPKEVDNYISKVITYETESPVGPWRAKNLIIADDSFERHSREAAEEFLSPAVHPVFIDQIDFPHETNPYLYHSFVDHPNPEARKNINKKYSSECAYAIIQALDKGALVAQYIGHGGAQLWSDERIFYGMDKMTSNLLELQPNKRFPFVISWSCLTGYLNLNFSPFNVCLAEEFIRYPDRGAIAMWAPSERGSPTQHMVMNHLFSRNIYEDGLTRLGEATLFTKIEFMLSQRYQDLINQYIFFGDPAVELAFPQEKLDIHYSPKTFKANSEPEFNLQATTGNMNEGQAIVSFYADGDNIYESEPFAFKEGKIAHSFAVSIGDVVNSTAVARIYAWNVHQQKDAWGGVKIPQFEPAIVLESGEYTKQEDSKRIRFDVRNQSIFAVENVRCTLEIGKEQYKLTVDSLPGHAAKTVTWTGEIPEDVHLVYASVEPDYSQRINGTSIDDKLVIPIKEPQEIKIVPLLSKLSYNSRNLVAGDSTRVRIPFQNMSTEEIASASLTLEGPGSAGDIKEVTLNPLESRRNDFSVTPPEKGKMEYRIIVRTDEKERIYTQTLEVKGKPDLALAEGDFSYSPEHPVIGKTVYICTTVYNVGESAANNIIVHAYDGDPSLKKRLDSFYRSGGVRIAELKPGEMKSIEITWDPDAYEGLGSHDIHLVVDPNDRINEISELNNRIRMELTLHNLPDLRVVPWAGHQMKLLSDHTIPVWGETLRLRGMVKNVGDSKAKRVRLSFMYNDEEITHFFNTIKAGGSAETSTDVPLVSAKNELLIHADKYDLIGEKNETAEIGNNASNKKRVDFQLRMPEAPVNNQRRVYRVTEETHFSAGKAEFLVFDEDKKQLKIQPNLETVKFRIQPAFVKNKDNYAFVAPKKKWQWNTKYNSFYSPLETDQVLHVEVPAPNGVYDVFVELYSVAYEQGTTENILIKCSNDTDYKSFEHTSPPQEDLLLKVGTYSIMDDNFMIEFKPVPGGYSTIVRDLVLVRSSEDKPVSTGYLSPYFPASGSGIGPVEMTWDAEVPGNTDMILKARWVLEDKDGGLRFFPWVRIVDGEEEKLTLPGKGLFYQYYVEMERQTHGEETPALSNVMISIPCKEEKSPTGPAR